MKRTSYLVALGVQEIRGSNFQCFREVSFLHFKTREACREKLSDECEESGTRPPEIIPHFLKLKLRPFIFSPPLLQVPVMLTSNGAGDGKRGKLRNRQHKNLTPSIYLIAGH